VEHDLKPYWKDYGLLGETSLVALVYHVMQILTQAFLAWGLGLQVPLAFFFIFVPVVNILGMIPVSFSGIGIRENGYLFFLAKVGVTRSAAVALGLLSSGVVLATGVTSGLAFLLSKSVAPVPQRKPPRAVSHAE
jgi:uncharacterized membrane protein YbhN (UPF0104 family)